MAASYLWLVVSIARLDFRMVASPWTRGVLHSDGLTVLSRFSSVVLIGIWTWSQPNPQTLKFRCCKHQNVPCRGFEARGVRHRLGVSGSRDR